MCSVAKLDTYAFGCMYQTAVWRYQILLADSLFEGDSHYVGVVIGNHLAETAFHYELHSAHTEFGGEHAIECDGGAPAALRSAANCSPTPPSFICW